jgi:preprotein translocase subunit SecG
MTTIIVTLHITVCILLILIVLLQSGKGAEMGVSLGGGSSQTLFGSSGPATILTKITTAVAIIFMLTSLTLAYFSGHQSESSVMTQTPAPIEQKSQQ